MSEQQDKVVIDGVEWDVIHRYTRAQAIEDGVLVAIDAKLRREAGFKIPIAMTSGVTAVVLPSEAERDVGQDVTGRAWDVLTMLRLAAAGAQMGQDTVLFDVAVLFERSRCGHGRVLEKQGRFRLEQVRLKAVVGPDDDGSPCLTLMLPNED